jgi:hypothetical protein
MSHVPLHIQLRRYFLSISFEIVAGGPNDIRRRGEQSEDG